MTCIHSCPQMYPADFDRWCIGCRSEWEEDQERRHLARAAAARDRRSPGPTDLERLRTTIAQLWDSGCWMP